jgi:RimJ/RimL family protein N-acetyltransferase
MLPSLRTPRLLLRTFRDSDAAGFAAYRSDPEVARYQSWEPPVSVADAAKIIAELRRTNPANPGQWHQYAIELKASGELIGDCAYHLMAPEGQQAEIGYSLARRFQGQGYGAEAVGRLLAYLFSDLRLHRVVALCDARNTASARLMERVGMRREAHYIENVWFKGAWGSEYAYAILQSEWARQTGQENPA